MSDDEYDDEEVTQKLNGVIDSLNDLNYNVQILESLNGRHNTMIDNMRGDIRDIRGKIRELETGNTGRRTRHSRRRNPRNIPALPPMVVGGRRTRRRRRKKRTRRKGGARTKKNTKYFTDPKTLKKVINPSFVKSKPQPVTLNITGVGPVTFDPKEVAQQRRMMTQHKKLSPTGRKNRGGRRKKRTRRRKSRRRMRGKRKGKTRRKRKR